MIDSITPKDLQRAMRLYKNGGSIMPSDVKADLDEFQEELKRTDLSMEDRTSFERAVSNILNKYPTEEELDAIDFEDRSIDYLSNGNWFKQHPEKLIGEIKIDKSRYGNEIQVLIGTLADLDKIALDSDLKQLAKNVSSGISSIKPTIEQNLERPSTNEFVETIIDESNKNIGKKAVRKKKNEEQNVNSDFTPKEVNIQTYQDIYKSLNSKISNEELRVYVWYKEQINQRLSLDWYKLAFGEEDPYKKIDEVQIKKWVNDGILFYSNGKLLPLPLYASGNVYEKTRRIVKNGETTGQDIDYILETYGSQALQEHIRVLNESYQKVYSNRLIITGNEDENSLILKPTSKFAKTFFIEKTETLQEFKWWESGKAGKGGRPNFEKLDGREYQKEKFETLSLTDAFCLWLVTLRNKLDFKGNITYDDIIKYYIQKRVKQTPSYLSEKQAAEFKANMERTKSKAASEGNRLFLQFLSEELDLNQKVSVEQLWNSSFNNYMKPDYDKIPVAFNITNSFFGEEPFVVKNEKREAVSFIFNEGSGCLAYDVGVGKSLSAIMIMEQFIVAGYSKRPFLVIPNQTYKQWLSELKNALPHRKINGLFNLGVDYVGEVMDENNEVMMVDEGSISVITYEGFQRLGFNDKTQSELLTSLYEILNQGGAEELMSEKKKAGFYEKLETLVGRGLKGTNVQIESLGFDFVCFDEAHALKKVFTSVKGEQVEGEKKAKKQYSIQSGAPSDTALKGFMIANYILKNNNYRNILLLTATPFTNSPLEVFSMLSLVAYHHLANLGVVNINDFFDNYIDVNSELVINHKLQPQYKQVVKGFNNLPSLQKIIFRFFNYKDGEDVGVIRPNKIVIPYTKRLVNGTIVKLDENEQVTCNVEMSSVQKEYMADVVRYAEGKGELSYGSADIEDIEESEMQDSDAATLDEDSLSDKEKAGVRALRSMNFSRNIALSPYLYEYNTLGTPTAKDYINTSPKLKYVMECIKSVKVYHEEHNEPVSGQVVYMDRGLKYFGLLKEYLINEIGFMPHEVGEITAKMSVDKKRLVQDAFLGRKYNEKIKEYENIDDSQRVKVLLGSSSIKEGMNLQTKSTVLYNCFLDWNPTDIIQLEGRIWRQKNQFANVRIVNPLVIDSIDIFMFQKLEEKTARINTIWSVNGKSVFKMEEIDPEEIKFALIKDPRVLASLEVETKSVKLQDDINSIKVINDRLENYLSALSSMNYYEDKVNYELQDFAPSKVSLDLRSKINYLVSFYKQENQKDEQGRPMIYSWLRQDFKNDIKNKDVEISPYEPKSRGYWFSSLTDYKRLVEKEEKDLLSVRNIEKDRVKEYIDFAKNSLKDIEIEIENLKSEDYIEKRSFEIEQKRLANKIEIKSVADLVLEFERLNYLLSIKMSKSEKVKKPFVYDKTIFLDENGVRKIDEKTIEMLTEGVSSLPQTKDLYVDENGNYTDDRLLYHYEIINDIKRNLNCIQSDSPIAILTGGSPASGKSTFLKSFAPYLLSNEIMKIDADEIRAKLPEYEGWNAATTHLETKDIVNTLLTDKEIGIPCQFDIIYDGTMNSTKNYLPLIGLLHQLGYKIFIVYMDNVPYDVVKERMLKRYQSSGRFVPVEVIDDFFSKGKQALDELKTKVEGYIVIDATSKDYDILEEGGMKLPTSRNYQQLGQRIKTATLVDKLIQATKILTTNQ